MSPRRGGQLTRLGLEIVRITVEDYGFNYNDGLFDQTVQDSLAQLCFVARKK